MQEVKFYGLIGPDGEWILDELRERDFPVDDIKVLPNEKTGSCVIHHREADGHENAVILYPGANAKFTRAHYKEALKKARSTDWLVCQNEINDVSYLMQLAKSKDMRIVFNPSPIPPVMSAQEWMRKYPTDILILNKHEATIIFQGLGFKEPALDEDDMAEDMISIIFESLCPDVIALTRGEQSSLVGTVDYQAWIETETVTVKDTTGAGDTFLGYFVGNVFQKSAHSDCMCDKAMYGYSAEIASVAAAISVTRKGALASIPYEDEVYDPESSL